MTLEVGLNILKHDFGMFLNVPPTHEPHHKPQQKQQQHFLEIIELKLNQQRKAHMETNNFLS